MEVEDENEGNHSVSERGGLAGVEDSGAGGPYHKRDQHSCGGPEE